MKWKLSFALILAAATLQLFSSQSHVLLPVDGKGIRHLVEAAKVERQKSLRLDAPMTLPLLVPTLTDAIENYTIVRALVSAKMPAVVDDRRIVTYYKLYALEFMVRQKQIENELRLPEAPSALLPLVHSELLMLAGGGSLTIEGMQVFQACGDDRYSLEVGKEYLMAVLLERGGELAFSAGGSATILRIEGQKLIPLRTEDNPFWQDILALHEGELDALLLHLRGLAR